MIEQFTDVFYQEVVRRTIRENEHYLTHINEIVRAHVREALRSRFPNQTYEEIVADPHNAQLLLRIERKLVRIGRKIAQRDIQIFRFLSRCKEAL